MIDKDEKSTNFIGYLDKGYSAVQDQDEFAKLSVSFNDPEIRSLVYLWYDLESRRIVKDDVIEKELKRFLAGVRNSRPATTVTRTTPIYRRIINAAAFFAIGALLTFLTFYFIDHYKHNQLFDQVVTVPLGSRIQLTLPDGTEVDLNAGSRLSYGKDFGLRSREVQLVGEGFFNVTGDMQKVFSVSTRAMVVRAYGTVFNVKAYPDETRTEATLVEGIIGIEKPGVRTRESEKLLLKPNQRIVYYSPSGGNSRRDGTVVRERVISTPVNSSKGQVVVSKGIKTELYTSWREGKLILKSEPLSEMAIKLERKYDVSIIIDERLQNYRFTGTFETETVEQVLEAIKIASHINYEIEDRDIRLIPFDK